MMKTSTPQQQIQEATEHVCKCMIENINAKRDITTAELRKQLAYHKLIKAKQFLSNLERELME